MGAATASPDADRGEARFGPKGDAKRRALIQAAYRTVLASGVQNLTFRAVATEAGVPLGSVSYYFASRNILVIEVLCYARERVQKRYRQVERRVKAGTSWIVAVADHVAWVTNSNLNGLSRDYEMFLYGLDHPNLSAISRSWTTASNEVLARILPADLRDVIAYMLEGMFLTAAKTGRRFTADEVRQHLQRIAGEGR